MEWISCLLDFATVSGFFDFLLRRLLESNVQEVNRGVDKSNPHPYRIVEVAAVSTFKFVNLWNPGKNDEVGNDHGMCKVVGIGSRVF